MAENDKKPVDNRDEVEFEELTNLSNTANGEIQLQGELVKIKYLKGESYYKANIKLNKNYLGNKPSHNRVFLDMALTADIKTGSKTLFKYLLKTNIQLFAISF